MAILSQRFKKRYSPEPVDYRTKRSRGSLGWLKQTAAALSVFAAVYAAAATETQLGQSVVEGVRYLLTTEADFAYLLDKAAPYLPQQLDTAVWKRVQTTVSRPADPLQYMVKPVDGALTATFGWQTHPVLKQQVLHEGIDIAAPAGTAVRAAASGQIRVVEESAQFGKIIIIEHSSEVQTVYGHLAEAAVKSGDSVTQGQLIGRVGQTGMTQTPKLYFAVSDKGKFVDPLTRIQGGFSGKDGA
ncbi:MAG: M23 family metallopeptidase [Sporomusaceae bacterium]|nr:M23 family metallopeptidase [Sporomusaceae bacterium]